MNEKMITANGVDICTDSFGDPADPGILLIMGAMASMLWWEEEFCQRLAGHGRHVIRYDLRDTGRSVAYEPGEPGYSVDDLVEDAVGVLGAYGIERAHIVGMSLGGMLGQIIAVKYPSRIITLTAIASGPFSDDHPDLPQIDQRVLDYHASSADLNWSDEHAVVEYMVAGQRILTGSAYPFDEAAARDLATREFRRARNLRSMMNYGVLGGGEQWMNRVREIAVPTLVIHGTEDLVLPYPHAEALAGDVPGATLLPMEGMGHELPQGAWDSIIDAIARHTE